MYVLYMNVMRFFLTVCALCLMAVVAAAIHARATSASGFMPSQIVESTPETQQSTTARRPILPSELNSLLTEVVFEDTTDTTQSYVESAADSAMDADDTEDDLVLLTLDSEVDSSPLDNIQTDGTGLLPVPDVMSRSEPAIAPIRHRAGLHDSFVTPGNFEYQGAFRPPVFDAAGKQFGFGGWAVAFRPDGDQESGDDGFTGSLFLVGSRNHQEVAEITIPQPKVQSRKSMDELPVARILQNFGDVTGGLRKRWTGDSSEPFEVGGMQVVRGVLHWSMFKFYNVASVDYPSHGVSTFDLKRPQPAGIWHLGPRNSGRSVWHSYKNAGYIFEIPQPYAKQWFGGRNLISGLQIATGLSAASHGPSMYAYGLPPRQTKAGRSLNAKALLFNDIQRPSHDFHPADRWTGGAWLTAGEKSVVVIIGRKALGEVYYGDARPTDCTPDKGYHGTPYEAQVRFFDPKDLARAANGTLDPTRVKPLYIWGQNSPGGPFSQYLFGTCQQHIGSTTYDRQNNLLYVVQNNAGTIKEEPYEVLPAIHVFKIVD